MTYEQIENLRKKEFKRLCGVKPLVFAEMVSTLKQELPNRETEVVSQNSALKTSY